MKIPAVPGPVVLSVVAPLYNESDLFEELLRRLKGTLDRLGLAAEMIFVDDGSSDRTLELVREAAALDGRVRYLSFSRNFGHQAAVSAGIEAARGGAVVVMDGDLQDPPECISEFVKTWRSGWDVVYGVRQKRKEGPFLRLAYFLFYRLLRRISEVELPLDAGDFCLMDRRVVDALVRMPEKNRFVRGIRAWLGFRQTALPYERDARFAGKSKYSIGRLIKLALDGVTSFSDFPLRLSAYAGFAIAGLSLLGLLYSLISKLFFDRTPQGWTSITIAVFFIGGVQLVMLSLVGGYVGRIYREVQGRPLYVLKESNVRAEPEPGGLQPSRRGVE